MAGPGQSPDQSARASFKRGKRGIDQPFHQGEEGGNPGVIARSSKRGWMFLGEEGTSASEGRFQSRKCSGTRSPTTEGKEVSKRKVRIGDLARRSWEKCLR